MLELRTGSPSSPRETREGDVHARLGRAERRVRVLTMGFALLLAGLGLAAADATRAPPEVLTARGLIIIDDAGRSRVVIGAPASDAHDDPRLETATGLVVLDTLNQLSVAVGTNPPLIMEDGSLGERVASSSGLTFYDPRDGKERGGIGAFSDGRAVACLDYGDASKEAACMVVAPGDEYAAVLLNGTPRERAFDRVGMFLGANGVGVLKAFGGVGSHDGVSITAGGGGGMPRVLVFDSTQTEVANLVEHLSR